MRYFFSVAVGIIVSLLLFLLMHGLVAGAKGPDLNQTQGKLVDFIRVKRDEVVNTKERRVPQKPPPPKKPPPPPKMNVVSQDKPPPTPLNIDTPDINVAVSTGSGPYIGSYSPGDPAAEGDIIPIVRIQPQYPREALLEGTEGWVRMEFTITENGSVTDVSVIESQPRRLFDRSAMRAIQRWKFKPRVIDGVAVARRADQTIEFKLDQQ